MAEKDILGEMETHCKEALEHMDGRPCYQRDILFLIARIRELEARSERQSMLLSDQTDRLGAANLRVIELERASHPGSGEADAVLLPRIPTAEMLSELLSSGEADAMIGMTPEHRALLMERAGIRERYDAMVRASLDGRREEGK